MPLLYHFVALRAAPLGHHDANIGIASDTDLLALSSGALNVNGTIECDTSIKVDAVTLTDTELGYIDGLTLGTAAASKALTIAADSTWTVAGMTCANIGTVTTCDINGGNNGDKVDDETDIDANPDHNEKETKKGYDKDNNNNNLEHGENPFHLRRRFLY